jgi:hypothetical protein
MTRAKALVLGIGVLVLAVAAGIAAASGPSVTITSPKTGSSVSLKRTPSLSISGGATFAAVNPTSTKLYLRRDGCGTSTDNPHLSVVAGSPDGGEGCGFIGGNGVAGEAAPGLLSADYPSSDGMPIILDTSRTIEGTFDLQNDTAGVGQVTLDFELEALVNGEGIVVGTDTENVLVDPTTSDYPVAFHITPNSALEKAVTSGLDLHVWMHGAYSDSGYTGLSGKSFFSVPGYSAAPTRSVQLSLDDASFANPIAATLNSSATGSTASVKTTAIGTHQLYARATQGYDTSAVASSTFKVSK